MIRRAIRACVVWVLLAEAKAVVRIYRPRIVAVTGSVGKTSTKDAIYAVLAAGSYARKSEKSFNSEIGVPLTILGCPNAWSNPLRWVQNIFHGLLLIVFRTQYPEWLVLEVGADKPGDISSVAAWLPVDVAVITRLPEVPVHVEFFSSTEQVVEEKASLITALKPAGTLVLFGDEDRTRALAARAEARGCNVVLFGFSDVAAVRGRDFALAMDENGRPLGMRFRIEIQKSAGAVESAAAMVPGVVGEHAALSLVAAAAVGSVLEKNPTYIERGLAAYEPPPGRMRLLPGYNGSLIIDDTYNSSPAAAQSALDALEFIGRAIEGHGIPQKRHIAVLGDMLELGRYSVEEHRKLGNLAARCVTLLATVGPRARDIAYGALDAGLPEASVLQFEDSRSAGMELKNSIGPGDCVLVKGSQGVRMERTVEALMLEPARASELLVRQDIEWKHKL